jgi:hypothetical protein
MKAKKKSYATFTINEFLEKQDTTVTMGNLQTCQ